MRSQITITLAFVALLGSVAVVGGQRLAALDARLRSESLDARGREAGAAKLARDLAQQREERAALLAEINRLEAELERLESDRRRGLEDLRAEFEGGQAGLRELLTSSVGQLGVLESSISKLEGAEYSDLIQELGTTVSERWGVLEARLDLTDGRLDSTTDALSQIGEKIDEQPDLDAMWNDLMGPVVKLTGADSVGSGVRLESVPVEAGYRTLVLTAWHVVRDIIDDEGSEGQVPVTLYDRFGIDTLSSAVLIGRDATVDLALLELTDHERHPNGARLASRDSINAMRVFEPIIAVGCPLGNDPVPSRGELSDTSHFVDGQRYWMINAPTFIGNSGGGVFDARTHELVGIFSKIYNYGSQQQTIIPHMGLLTPLDIVYDWVASLDADEPLESLALAR